LKKLLILTALLAPSMASAQLKSTPTLGMAEGRCRANEPGPAFMINVVGLKDRGGTMKAELYPANDTDFLADDNIRDQFRFASVRHRRGRSPWRCFMTVTAIANLDCLWTALVLPEIPTR
jgi:hypothetical protein